MISLFQIEHDDPLPLYAQLEREIKSAVALGKLQIGDRLPTVRGLAVELRMNANTVARVYAALEQEGILNTRRGVGTFVEALPSSAASHSLGWREKERRLCVERFLSEAVSKGFTKDELLLEVQYIFSQLEEKSHVR
jgi:GntR family transcriptional regulator